MLVSMEGGSEENFKEGPEQKKLRTNPFESPQDALNRVSYKASLVHKTAIEEADTKHEQALDKRYFLYRVQELQKEPKTEERDGLLYIFQDLIDTMEEIEQKDIEIGKISRIQPMRKIAPDGSDTIIRHYLPEDEEDEALLENLLEQRDELEEKSYEIFDRFAESYPEDYNQYMMSSELHEGNEN